MESTIIGIIGGSGLYNIEGLEGEERISLSTPFGAPSSPITVAVVNGVQLLFIARHGVGHVHLPSEVNYRANIYALKSLGAQWCLSVSAVGSLDERFAPGDVVIPDQLIDRTSKRVQTFFEGGLCAHVPFATPFCPVLSSVVENASDEVARSIDSAKRPKVHRDATYVCIEGPMFSTRAESHLYRKWGASIIGMTAIPEAKLAREAEIAYATLAMITDYDCWRSADEDVDISDILRVMSKNTEFAKQVITKVIELVKATKPSRLASTALENSIVTSRDLIPQEKIDELYPIIGRVIRS